MAQVDQSLSWSNNGLYFELCKNYLYPILFRCSLFRDNPRCEPMLTKTTLTKTQTKSHDRKDSFGLSRPIKGLFMRHYITLILTPYSLQYSVDLQLSVDHTSNVFLHV